MQLKVESDSLKSTQERNCTSSVYISQPPSSSLQNVVSEPSLVASGSAATKPVLTIQVNQNNSQYNENANGNNNLVNIVSCFRAYPTITAHGIENVAHNNSSVSVNRNYCNDESVNNENNQNIVNVECRRQALSTPIKREDLNEISVDVTNGDANVNSNVDYQNMALDSVTARDRVGLIGSEREKIVIGNGGGVGGTTTTVNPSPDNLINQITIVIESGGAKDSQREQRRRDRRERRQARQRAAAQHGHHRHRISSINAAAVHQRAQNNRGTMVNGAEQASSRATYEMLPDIINNHLPPPYTTLPHHQLPQPHPVTTTALHSPPIIAAAPVIVDDCRFSFPIPIIRR